MKMSILLLLCASLTGQPKETPRFTEIDRALELLDTNSYEQAYRVLEGVSDQDAGEFRIWLLRAHLLFQLKRYDESFKAFEESKKREESLHYPPRFTANEEGAR